MLNVIITVEKLQQRVHGLPLMAQNYCQINELQKLPTKPLRTSKINKYQSTIEVMRANKTSLERILHLNQIRILMNSTTVPVNDILVQSIVLDFYQTIEHFMEEILEFMVAGIPVLVAVVSVVPDVPDNLYE